MKGHAGSQPGINRRGWYTRISIIYIPHQLTFIEMKVSARDERVKCVVGAGEVSAGAALAGQGENGSGQQLAEFELF